MPYEQHQEKPHTGTPQATFQAVLAASARLGASIVLSDPVQGRLEARFPKTILGRTLGERTYLTCEVRPEGAASRVVVDAYPLDAVERKLLFGARKGVTQAVVALFLETLDAV